MGLKWAGLKRQLRFTYDLFAAAALTWVVADDMHHGTGTRSTRETVLVVAAYVTVVGFLLFNAYRRWSRQRLSLPR